MQSTSVLDPIERIRTNVEAMAERLELYTPGVVRPPAPKLSELRRARSFGARPGIGTISLVERGGMLFWELGGAVPTQFQNVRRFRHGGTVYGNVILTKEFLPLEPNQVGRYLDKLDLELTPERGLREWKTDGCLVPVNQVAPEGKILLFVHGTFSKSDHLFEEMQQAPNGYAFLARAVQRYTQILAFDHATVSVSPMINAMDLRNALASSRADVDIVCHSRGGLVSRWWIEIFDTHPARHKRAVFVASPLGGTSLAAPPRLKAGLNVLATFAKLLGTAAMAIPFMTAPAALLRIFGSVTGITAKLPLVDAAVAMIPGLSGQSRVENNHELDRLNPAVIPRHPGYFYVRSNFQSPDPHWKLWKYVTDGQLRAAETIADLLVFPGENDLVVDMASMTEPGVLPAESPDLLDFGTNGDVHHTNYFRQMKTLEFIADRLQIP